MNNTNTNTKTNIILVSLSYGVLCDIYSTAALLKNKNSKNKGKVCQCRKHHFLGRLTPKKCPTLSTSADAQLTVKNLGPGDASDPPKAFASRRGNVVLATADDLVIVSISNTVSWRYPEGQLQIVDIQNDGNIANKRFLDCVDPVEFLNVQSNFRLSMDNYEAIEADNPYHGCYAIAVNEKTNIAPSKQLTIAADILDFLTGLSGSYSGRGCLHVAYRNVKLEPPIATPARLSCLTLGSGAQLAMQCGDIEVENLLIYTLDEEVFESGDLGKLIVTGQIQFLSHHNQIAVKCSAMNYWLFVKRPIFNENYHVYCEDWNGEKRWFSGTQFDDEMYRKIAGMSSDEMPLCTGSPVRPIS